MLNFDPTIQKTEYIKEMKTSIKSALLLIIALLGVGVVSCDPGDDNTETITAQSFQSCYAIVNDLEDSSNQTVCTSVVIQLTLNWNRGTAEASMTGLSIGGQTYPVVKIKDMQWGVQDGDWGFINCKTPTMETSASGVTPAITDFNLRWLDRLDFAPFVGIYDPGCEFSFIIDGRYLVVGSRQPFVLAGETSSTDDEGNVFQTLRSVYTVGLDFKNRTATIAITQAQFVDLMPMLTMKFENIPFTIVDAGKRIILDADELIPSMSGTPQPEFPISNLHADITPGTGMSLTFQCDYRKKKVYTVRANVDYSNYKTAMGE